MTHEKPILSAAAMRKLSNTKPKKASVEPASVYLIEGQRLTVSQITKIASERAPKIKPDTVRKRVEAGCREWADILRPVRKGLMYRTQEQRKAVSVRGAIKAVDARIKKGTAKKRTKR